MVSFHLVALVMCLMAAVAMALPSSQFYRRAILLDDGQLIPIEEAPLMRERRSAPYAAESGYPKGGYSKGRVGPVYTFVKTDYNGNFKWGVRHRAGEEYGR